MKELERKVEADSIEYIRIQIEDTVPEFLTNHLVNWLEKYVKPGALIKKGSLL